MSFEQQITLGTVFKSEAKDLLRDLTSISEVAQRIAANLGHISKASEGLKGKSVPINNLVASIDKLGKGAGGSADNIGRFATELDKAGKSIGANSKEVEKARKSYSGLGNESSALTGTLSDLSVKFQQIAKYAVSAFGVYELISVLRAGSQAVIDFSQNIQNLIAITGESVDKISVLESAIKDVVRETKFFPSEIGQGMTVLAQSGFNVEESINAMAANARLATGTLSDMTKTTDLLTSAIRAFNLESSDSGRIVDIFANAINKSKLTIDKIRVAFNYIGVAARQAGLTVEETAASMMLLANNGLRASTIGTGLRQVIANLLNPSKALAEALQAQGLALSDLNPGIVGYRKVLENLVTLLWDAEKGAIDMAKAFQFFKLRGSQAVAVLVKSMATTKDFDKMIEAVNRVGTSFEMAAKQAEGLDFKLKNLRGRAELVAIAIGEGGVTDVVKVFIDALAKLADLMERGFSSAMGSAATQITAIGAAIGGALVSLKAFGKFLGNRKSVQSFGDSLKSLAIDLSVLNENSRAAAEEMRPLNEVLAKNEKQASHAANKLRPLGGAWEKASAQAKMAKEQVDRAGGAFGALSIRTGYATSSMLDLASAANLTAAPTTKMVQPLDKLATSLGKFKALTPVLAGVSFAIGGLSRAFTAFIASNPIAAISIGLSGLVAVADKLNVTLEEQAEALSKITMKAKQAAASLGDLKVDLDKSLGIKDKTERTSSFVNLLDSLRMQHANLAEEMRRYAKVTDLASISQERFAAILDKKLFEKQGEAISTQVEKLSLLKKAYEDASEEHEKILKFQEDLKKYNKEASEAGWQLWKRPQPPQIDNEYLDVSGDEINQKKYNDALEERNKREAEYATLLVELTETFSEYAIKKKWVTKKTEDFEGALKRLGYAFKIPEKYLDEIIPRAVNKTSSTLGILSDAVEKTVDDLEDFGDSSDTFLLSIKNLPIEVVKFYKTLSAADKADMATFKKNIDERVSAFQKYAIEVGFSRAEASKGVAAIEAEELSNFIVNKEKELGVTEDAEKRRVQILKDFQEQAIRDYKRGYVDSRIEAESRYIAYSEVANSNLAKSIRKKFEDLQGVVTKYIDTLASDYERLQDKVKDVNDEIRDSEQTLHNDIRDIRQKTMTDEEKWLSDKEEAHRLLQKGVSEGDANALRDAQKMYKSLAREVQGATDETTRSIDETTKIAEEGVKASHEALVKALEKQKARFKDSMDAVRNEIKSAQDYLIKYKTLVKNASNQTLSLNTDKLLSDLEGINRSVSYFEQKISDIGNLGVNVVFTGEASSRKGLTEKTKEVRKDIDDTVDHISKKKAVVEVDVQSPDSDSVKVKAKVDDSEIESISREIKKASEGFEPIEIETRFGASEPGGASISFAEKLSSIKNKVSSFSKTVSNLSTMFKIAFVGDGANESIASKVSRTVSLFKDAGATISSFHPEYNVSFVSGRDPLAKKARETVDSLEDTKDTIGKMAGIFKTSFIDMKGKPVSEAIADLIVESGYLENRINDSKAKFTTLFSDEKGVPLTHRFGNLASEFSGVSRDIGGLKTSFKTDFVSGDGVPILSKISDVVGRVTKIASIINGITAVFGINFVGRASSEKPLTEKISEVWSKIARFSRDVASSVAEFVVGFVTDKGAPLTEGLSWIANKVKSFYSMVTGFDFSIAFDFVSSKGEPVIDYVQQVWDKVKSFFELASGQALSFGVGIVSKVGDIEIGDYLALVKDKISGFVGYGKELAMDIAVGIKDAYSDSFFVDSIDFVASKIESFYSLIKGLVPNFVIKFLGEASSALPLTEKIDEIWNKVKKFSGSMASMATKFVLGFITEKGAPLSEGLSWITSKVKDFYSMVTSLDFSFVFDFISSKGGSVTDYIQKVWNQIKNFSSSVSSGLVSIGVGIVSKVGDVEIGDYLDLVKTKFFDFIDFGKNAATDIAIGVKDAYSDLPFAEGIGFVTSKIKDFYDFIKGLVPDFVVKFLGEASSALPLTEKIDEIWNKVQGVAEWISGTAATFVTKFTTDLGLPVGNAVEWIRDKVKGLVSFLSGLKSLVKIWFISGDDGAGIFTKIWKITKEFGNLKNIISTLVPIFKVWFKARGVKGDLEEGVKKTRGMFSRLMGFISGKAIDFVVNFMGRGSSEKHLTDKVSEMSDKIVGFGKNVAGKMPKVSLDFTDIIPRIASIFDYLKELVSKVSGGLGDFGSGFLDKITEAGESLVGAFDNINNALEVRADIIENGYKSLFERMVGTTKKMAGMVYEQAKNIVKAGIEVKNKIQSLNSIFQVTFVGTDREKSLVEGATDAFDSVVELKDRIESIGAKFKVAMIDNEKGKNLPESTKRMINLFRSASEHINSIKTFFTTLFTDESGTPVWERVKKVGSDFMGLASDISDASTQFEVAFEGDKKMPLSIQMYDIQKGFENMHQGISGMKTSYEVGILSADGIPLTSSLRQTVNGVKVATDTINGMAAVVDVGLGEYDIDNEKSEESWISKKLSFLKDKLDDLRKFAGKAKLIFGMELLTNDGLTWTEKFALAQLKIRAFYEEARDKVFEFKTRFSTDGKWDTDKFVDYLKGKIKKFKDFIKEKTEGINIPFMSGDKSLAENVDLLKKKLSNFVSWIKETAVDVVVKFFGEASEKQPLSEKISSLWGLIKGFVTYIKDTVSEFVLSFVDGEDNPLSSAFNSVKDKASDLSSNINGMQNLYKVFISDESGKMSLVDKFKALAGDMDTFKETVDASKTALRVGLMAEEAGVLSKLPIPDALKKVVKAVSATKKFIEGAKATFRFLFSGEDEEPVEKKVPEIKGKIKDLYESTKNKAANVTMDIVDSSGEFFGKTVDSVKSKMSALAEFVKSIDLKAVFKFMGEASEQKPLTEKLSDIWNVLTKFFDDVKNKFKDIVLKVKFEIPDSNKVNSEVEKVFNATGKGKNTRLNFETVVNGQPMTLSDYWETANNEQSAFMEKWKARVAIFRIAFTGSDGSVESEPLSEQWDKLKDNATSAKSKIDSMKAFLKVGFGTKRGEDLGETIDRYQDRFSSITRMIRNSNALYRVGVKVGSEDGEVGAFSDIIDAIDDISKGAKDKGIAIKTFFEDGKGKPVGDVYDYVAGETGKVIDFLDKKQAALHVGVESTQEGSWDDVQRKAEAVSESVNNLDTVFKVNFVDNEDGELTSKTSKVMLAFRELAEDIYHLGAKFVIHLVGPKGREIIDDLNNFVDDVDAFAEKFIGKAFGKIKGAINGSISKIDEEVGDALYAVVDTVEIWVQKSRQWVGKYVKIFTLGYDIKDNVFTQIGGKISGSIEGIGEAISSGKEKISKAFSEMAIDFVDHFGFLTYTTDLFKSYMRTAFKFITRPFAILGKAATSASKKVGAGIAKMLKSFKNLTIVKAATKAVASFGSVVTEKFREILGSLNIIQRVKSVIAYFKGFSFVEGVISKVSLAFKRFGTILSPVLKVSSKFSGVIALLTKGLLRVVPVVSYFFAGWDIGRIISDMDLFGLLPMKLKGYFQIAIGMVDGFIQKSKKKFAEIGEHLSKIPGFGFMKRFFSDMKDDAEKNIDRINDTIDSIKPVEINADEDGLNNLGVKVKRVLETIGGKGVDLVVNFMGRGSSEKPLSEKAQEMENVINTFVERGTGKVAKVTVEYKANVDGKEVSLTVGGKTAMEKLAEQTKAFEEELKKFEKIFNAREGILEGGDYSQKIGDKGSTKELLASQYNDWKAYYGKLDSMRKIEFKKFWKDTQDKVNTYTEEANTLRSTEDRMRIDIKNIRDKAFKEFKASIIKDMEEEISKELDGVVGEIEEASSRIMRASEERISAYNNQIHELEMAKIEAENAIAKSSMGSSDRARKELDISIGILSDMSEQEIAIAEETFKKKNELNIMEVESRLGVQEAHESFMRTINQSVGELSDFTEAEIRSIQERNEAYTMMFQKEVELAMTTEDKIRMIEIAKSQERVNAIRDSLDLAAKEFDEYERQKIEIIEGGGEKEINALKQSIKKRNNVIEGGFEKRKEIVEASAQAIKDIEIRTANDTLTERERVDLELIVEREKFWKMNVDLAKDRNIDLLKLEEDAAEAKEKLWGEGVNSLKEFEEKKLGISTGTGEKILKSEAEWQVERAKFWTQNAGLAKDKEKDLEGIVEDGVKARILLREDEYSKVFENADQAIKAAREETEGVLREEGEKSEKTKILSRKVLEAKIKNYEEAGEKLKSELERALGLEKQIAQEIMELNKGVAEEKESTERKIRELRRSNMSDQAAYEDEWAEINERMARAKQLLASSSGDEVKQGLDLVKELKSEVSGMNKEIKEGDQVIVSREASTKKTIASLNTLQDLFTKGSERLVKGKEKEKKANEENLKAIQTNLDKVEERLDTFREKSKLKIEVDNDTINKLDQSIQDINKQIEMDKIFELDTSAAEDKLDDLKKKIEEIKKLESSMEGGSGEAPYKSYFGGQVPPLKPGIDTIDARLTAGEYVEPISAVKKYGTKFFDMLRLGKIPVENVKNMMSSAYGKIKNASFDPMSIMKFSPKVNLELGAPNYSQVVFDYHRKQTERQKPLENIGVIRLEYGESKLDVSGDAYSLKQFKQDIERMKKVKKNRGVGL